MNVFLRLFICCILCVGVACGKKGPPVPPKVIIPQSAKNLKGEMIQERVRLSWTMPRGEKQCRLFKAVVPLTGDFCADCPVRFTEQLDIDITDSNMVDIEGDKVTYWDSIEPENHHIYKVIVISEDGGQSKDSDTVAVCEMQNAK